DGVLSLQFGEFPVLRGVVGKFVVGEGSPWNNVRSHLNSSRVGCALLETFDAGIEEASDESGDLIGGGIQCEMASIDDVHFGLGHIAAVGFGLRGIEGEFVLAPKDQEARLL